VEHHCTSSINEVLELDWGHLIQTSLMGISSWPGGQHHQDLVFLCVTISTTYAWHLLAVPVAC